MVDNGECLFCHDSVLLKGASHSLKNCLYVSVFRAHLIPGLKADHPTDEGLTLSPSFDGFDDLTQDGLSILNEVLCTLRRCIGADAILRLELHNLPLPHLIIQCIEESGFLVGVEVESDGGHRRRACLMSLELIYSAGGAWVKG